MTSVLQWLRDNADDLLNWTVQHTWMSLVPVGLAFLIALPLGYLVSRAKLATDVLLMIFGLVYAVPSLALFVAMPIFLGTKILDPTNIVAALTIYAVALLVRSVVDGLRSAPGVVIESADALGYGRWRRLLRVELPLAMPVIFAGLRTVTVANIALVSVGTVVGTGALGTLFEIGFNRAFLTPIIVGMGLSLLLAVLADLLLVGLQRLTLPWYRGART